MIAATSMFSNMIDMFKMIEHGREASFAAQHTHMQSYADAFVLNRNRLKVKVLYYQHAAVAFWQRSCLQAMSKAANPNKPKKTGNRGTLSNLKSL